MTQDAVLNDLIHDLEPYLASQITALQDGSVGSALYAKLLAVMQQQRIVPSNDQISTLHMLARVYGMRGMLLQIQWRATANVGCSACE